MIKDDGMIESEYEDTECICKGNWRAIVRESEHLIGKRFHCDRDGNDYTFFGLVHGDDDYYYGMCSAGRPVVLASCVGDLQGNGFTLIPDDE
jgi:hypothetical protein